MKNVVILGAGYAGLTTLKGLKKAAKAGEVKVTLVNKNSYHYEICYWKKHKRKNTRSE